jgi:hypothetical protein
MKHLLIGIGLLLSSCQYEPKDEGVYDYTNRLNGRDLAICKAIAKEYAPDATIYILDDQPLSYNLLGLANQIGDHTYLIQLNITNVRELETLFHEMGHIIDSEEGRLDFTGDMRWDGEVCDFNQPWWDRPWEQSANQWRDCLRYEYQTGRLKHYRYVYELLPQYLHKYKGDSQYQGDTCL